MLHERKLFAASKERVKHPFSSNIINAYVGRQKYQLFSSAFYLPLPDLAQKSNTEFFLVHMSALTCSILVSLVI